MKFFQFWLIRGKIETGGGQWFVARGAHVLRGGEGMFRRVRGDRRTATGGCPYE